MSGILPTPGPGGRPPYVFVSGEPVTPQGGVNSVILGLMDAMRDRYTPRILITGWERPPAGQVWRKMPGLRPTLRGTISYFAYLLWNLPRLAPLVRGSVAVNVHFPGPDATPYVLLRRLGFFPRLILSVHGADLTLAEQSHGLERAIYRWMFQHADTIIACSSALGQRLQRFEPGLRVAAVLNACQQPPTDLRPRPLANPYLVCVAGYVRKKGHDVLLRAFAPIAKRRPELHLVMLGREGPERTAIQTQIHELGLEARCHVLLNVPHGDVWSWVRHAECLVLPSRDEPFGIALLEAALVNTPVVATRVGGIPEFVEDGVHALLCDPDQPEKLAQAIQQTLDDPQARQLRVDAFHTHALGFTWDRVLADYRATAGLP
jgi:glycosyltransferase involved in cell wall biosynthesis